MNCPHCQQPIDIDSDGETVRSGDRIRFSYGIPPVRAEGLLTVIKGELWALVPGHKPARAPLAEIRDCCEHFYKLP